MNPEPHAGVTQRRADLKFIVSCRGRRGLRQFAGRGNRRDAKDAEMLASGAFSASVASLRSPRLSVSVGAWPRCTGLPVCYGQRARPAIRGNRKDARELNV